MPYHDNNDDDDNNDNNNDNNNNDNNNDSNNNNTQMHNHVILRNIDKQQINSKIMSEKETRYLLQKSQKWILSENVEIVKRIS